MFNSVGAFFSGAGPGHKSGGSVSCSICLEIVTDNGTRSWAKLQCGHEFHLDCIGSAFNAKGAMECPNCRKIEKGQWLYANGSIASISSYPGSSIDEPINDEDNYDSSNSELSPGVLWCPFDQLPHFSSVLEDEEYYSATDHDISGENAVHVEHTAASSSSHPSSYVAYPHPVHPLDNLSGTVSDSSDFSTHWNCPTTVNDMHAFQTMDVNYEGWEHGHPPFLTGRSNVSAADLLSVPAFPPDSAWAVLERSRSFLQPPPASYRAGTSAASSIVPPFPGSNARTQDRVQALQAYYHLQPLNTPSVQNCVISSDERASNHRGLAQVGPIVLPDQADNFFTFPSITDHNFQEADNRQPFYSHSWDLNQLPPFSSNQVNRDPVWGPFYQYPSCPSPAVRFINSFQQRHGSERTS